MALERGLGRAWHGSDCAQDSPGHESGSMGGKLVIYHEMNGGATNTELPLKFLFIDKNFQPNIYD